MIETYRFKRLMPLGVVSVVQTEDKLGVNVTFLRWDHETGQPADPEVSYLSWAEIEETKEKAEKDLEMLSELLKYKV